MAKFLITVKPGSSQEKIIESAHGELTVYLRAKPHDGEANTALIKLISKHFNIPKNVYPYSVIVLGYPTEDYTGTDRFDKDRIHYEFYKKK